ncbi:MAG: hypothetical protein M5T61_19135 [Acidimicrobiia bacterium]|nr:hypothetical protein [Acidimicrobiia bacterium]
MTVVSGLRRLLAEAAPAPWSCAKHLIIADTRDEVIADSYGACDAALIVALRNHAAALLDVVEAAEGLQAGLWAGDGTRPRLIGWGGRRPLRDALARLDAKETP